MFKLSLLTRDWFYLPTGNWPRPHCFLSLLTWLFSPLYHHLTSSYKLPVKGSNWKSCNTVTNHLHHPAAIPGEVARGENGTCPAHNGQGIMGGGRMRDDEQRRGRLCCMAALTNTVMRCHEQLLYHSVGECNLWVSCDLLWCIQCEHDA